MTRNEQGQSGIFIVLNLTLIFAIMGLSTDVGIGYLTRQQAQAAADASATAAARYASQNGHTCGTNGVVCGATACADPNIYPPVNNLQVGCLYAQANGYLNGGKRTVTLTANTTAPPGVSGNTPAYWVQASISDQPTALFGLFARISSFTINAVSTAGVTITPANSCVYVLASGSVAGAFLESASATVTATCGIYVNSTSATAFSLSASATAHATSIQVVGGASITATAAATPTPTTGVTAFSDPLASLPMPTFSGCNYTNYSLTNTSTATLSPGVYCGGISITQSAVATLNPGLYILNGGGLNVGNTGQLTGSGVTFFNTGQSGYTAAPIVSSNNTVLTLSAPTTGTYEGMLFIQDRNLTYPGANSFANGSSSVMTGTLYFPSTSLAYSGASSTGSYMAVVAKTVTFSGNSSLKNDPTGTYTGLAVRGTSLIN